MHVLQKKTPAANIHNLMLHCQAILHRQLETGLSKKNRCTHKNISWLIVDHHFSHENCYRLSYIKTQAGWQTRRKINRKSNSWDNVPKISCFIVMFPVVHWPLNWWIYPTYPTSPPWARPKKIELLKITAAKIPGSGYHRGHTSALHIMCLTGKKKQKKVPGLPSKIHGRTIHKQEVIIFSMYITNHIWCVGGGNYVNSKNKPAGKWFDSAAKFVLKWRL